MRRIFLFLLSVTLVLSLIPLGSAFPAEKGKKAIIKEKVQRGLYFYGIVSSVDPESNLMTVKNWRGSVTLDTTNANLKGYKDIRDISPGDRIKVRYTTFGIEIGKLQKGKR